MLYSNYEAGSAVKKSEEHYPAVVVAWSEGIIVFLPTDPRILPPYLWSHPLLPVGCLCLNHTLGPGSDIPGTVISIALEDQLARAFLAGKEGTEYYAISYAVQDLKPVKKHVGEKRSGYRK